MDFNSFFNAIAQQESGGNYSAVNGNTGALGKYQIMPKNVPAWSQQYLGVNWTPAQFLGDPTKQEALARAVLQDYFDKWGARGAASAWYSGSAAKQNDYTPQSNGPSIGEYVDSVLGKAGLSMGSSNASTASNHTPTMQFINKTIQPFYAAPEDAAKKAILGTSTGAESAPGIDAVPAPGSEATSAPGSEAVSDVTTQPAPQPPTHADGMGPFTIDSPAAHAPGGMAGSNARRSALEAGLQWLGTPYVYGGGSARGPSKSALAHGNPNDVGFDCSGLIQYIFAQVGINMPRLSYDQLKMGDAVPMNQLQAGDLVGFGDGHHIAYYLGHGEILEAPSTGKNVRIRTLGKNEDVWGVSLARLY